MRKTVWFGAMVSVGLLGGARGMAAQSSVDPMGEWVVRLGHRTLLVLSIQVADKEGQACAGSLSRPQHFQTGDGISFNHVTGPAETEPIVACERKADTYAITVQNPRDSSDQDKFQLTVQNSSQADLQIDGALLPPMKLERATGAAVSTDWEPNKSYSPDDDTPSNLEMKRIFDEDQRVRQPGFKIDWKVVGATDAQRREQTRKLLNDGELHTGEDFVCASFVFQHGSTPEDYLLAHTLAIVALKKGEQDGAWIASATLDRYLQSIKQPQIYGTQFLTPQGKPTTQEPYNRTLISDPLRRQLGVPSMEDQQKQRADYDKQQAAASKQHGR